MGDTSSTCFDAITLLTFALSFKDAAESELPTPPRHSSVDALLRLFCCFMRFFVGPGLCAVCLLADEDEEVGKGVSLLTILIMSSPEEV